MQFLRRDLVQEFWKGISEVGKRWWNHNHSRSAAALAFYSLFSMIPILLIVTRLAAAFIGKDMAEEGVEQGVEMFFDENASKYLQDLVLARPSETFTGISSVIGFFVLLFTASKVVVELRDVLTVVFGKKAWEGRKGFIIHLVLSQVVPLLLVLALGAVLAMSAFAGAALQLISTHLNGFLPVDLQLWEWAQRVIPLIFSILLFTLILRWLPPRPPKIVDSMIGAAVACVLLSALRSLIAFYFGHSSVATGYGAAVTLVVILLWIYFTIQIFFIGAETAAYLDRKRRGETGQPEAKIP